MLDIVSFDIVLVYLVSMLSISAILYFIVNKKNRPFNIIDGFVYEIFILSSFISMVVVLTYLGLVSTLYIILYTLSFIAFFCGMYLGARVNFRVRPVFIEKTIFTQRYFYPVFVLGLFTAVYGLFMNFDTWSLEGDAHLNRLTTAHSNTIIFHLIWATSNSVIVYLMLSVKLCKSR